MQLVERTLINERRREYQNDKNVLLFTSAASCLLTTCILGWVSWFCRYGFDFTDEGLYLNWISHPYNYAPSISQFGFVYHPLYKLVGGNIVALRVVNLIVSFCLATVAAWTILGRVIGAQSFSGIFKLSVATAFAVTTLVSLIFAGMWMPTPSYNTLTFQGLLIAAIGLVLADNLITRSSLFGWIFIGVGGWLTFLGKPSSAATLAVIAASYLVLSGKIRTLQLTIALGTTFGLLALSALVIDGSMIEFLDHYKEGIRLAKLLSANYDIDKILRLEPLILSKNVTQVSYLIVAVVFSAVWVAKLKIGWFDHVGLVVSAMIAILGIIITFRYVPLQSIPLKHHGLLLFGIPAGLALAIISMSLFRGLSKIGWSNWVLFLVFIAFPYAYAFGTAGNYWIRIEAGGVFVCLAVLFILGPAISHPRASHMLLGAGFTVQILVVVLIKEGLSAPYRQPQPLQNNTMSIEIGNPRSNLILSTSHAQYLSSVLEIANQGGFEYGTPMIDLTGHQPGVLYALGANSIGLAWMIGGYPGSSEFVTQALHNVKCNLLIKAWILSEPLGPRALPKTVLASFGANLESDYQTLGEVKSPEGQIQYLLKPTGKNQDALHDCEAARANEV